MSSVQRIKKYLDFKGITIQNYESSVGYSNGAFGSQIRNNGKIGSDKLEKTLSLYTDLSAEWVLLGKGEMLNDDKTNEPNPDYQKTKTQKGGFIDETIEQKLDIIIRQNKEILERFRNP
ncbi:hypothetical protein [Winogradskyella sp.]|uniref:hypothetical protein n=1 Tax=Winogradskyella sp. TaxID=1883156 RepID=UPI00260182C9|nr:hypothetical protein [Winogradskyella sp.]